MRSAENMTKMVKRLHFAAGNEMDGRIWHGILEAQEGLETKRAAQREPGIWRIIMKSGITKLTAIGAIVMIGVFVAITQLKDSTGPTEDLGGQEGAAISQLKDSVGRTDDIGRQESRTTSTAGRLSLAQQVARSSAIVRATLEEVTDKCSRWRIERVLFGDVEQATVDLGNFPVGVGRIQLMQNWKRAIEDGVGRNLTTEEIWEEFHRIYPDWPVLGKEVILFLERQGDDYGYQGAAYDVPAISALDDFEERLLSVIESGEHKSVSGEDRW